MGNPRQIHGLSVGIPWVINRQLTGNSWATHGQPTNNPLITHGALHGLLNGSPLAIYRQIMGRLIKQKTRIPLRVSISLHKVIGIVQFQKRGKYTHVDFVISLVLLINIC